MAGKDDAAERATCGGGCPEGPPGGVAWPRRPMENEAIRLKGKLALFSAMSEWMGDAVEDSLSDGLK